VGDCFRVADYYREVEVGLACGVAQDPSDHPTNSRVTGHVGCHLSWPAFYRHRPGLRFARGSRPRASRTTAA
jgi:hypothetical protein